MQRACWYILKVQSFWCAVCVQLYVLLVHCIFLILYVYFIYIFKHPSYKHFYIKALKY